MANGKARCRRMSVPLSYTIHKYNFKWIKELNVRHETIKVLEENIGSSHLFDLSCSNFFLDTFLEAKETKAIRNHRDFIKIETCIV